MNDNYMKFSGIVTKHLGRGTKLGFPTANIPAPKEIADATYLAWVLIAPSPGATHHPPPKGEGNPSIVFVGAPQTFDETDRRAEAYLLDFSGDLYGQEISIEIIKKLRDNKKFESEQALIEQMKLDEQLAREFFKSYN